MGDVRPPAVTGRDVVRALMRAGFDTLKLSNAKRTVASTPEGRLRERLNDAIRMQIEAAEALVKGVPFSATLSAGSRTRRQVRRN